MHLRITNKSAKALDDYRFTFGSAGALKLHNEYSGLASEAAPILPSQNWTSSDNRQLEYITGDVRTERHYAQPILIPN